MKIFHSHNFVPSSSNPAIIYCKCGQIKDLHQHFWSENGVLTENRLTGNAVIGQALKCTICGDLKFVDIYQQPLNQPI